jgi:hypothetical protein
MIRIEDEDDTYAALIIELGPAPISRIFRQRSHIWAAVEIFYKKLCILF